MTELSPVWKISAACGGVWNSSAALAASSCGTIMPITRPRCGPRSPPAIDVSRSAAMVRFSAAPGVADPALVDEFAASLQNADRVAVSEVFVAREKPDADPQDIAEDLAARTRARAPNVLPDCRPHAILEL